MPKTLHHDCQAKALCDKGYATNIVKLLYVYVGLVGHTDKLTYPTTLKYPALKYPTNKDNVKRMTFFHSH